MGCNPNYLLSVYYVINEYKVMAYLSNTALTRYFNACDLG